MSTTDLGNKKVFAHNLQQFVDKQDMTVPQLAEHLGVKYTTFRDWLKGNTYPRIDKIELLADYFGVKKSALVEKHASKLGLPFHSYPYFPAEISAGALTTVDPITQQDVKQIDIPDAFMGRYSGDNDIRIMHVNGKSMDRIIPDGSLIGVKQIEDASQLKDGDIVVFAEDDEDYAVKKFSKDARSGNYVFSPDSYESDYYPIVYSPDDCDSLTVIGRVVVYVVTL